MGYLKINKTKTNILVIASKLINTAVTKGLNP